MAMLGLQTAIARLCLCRDFRGDFTTDAASASQQIALSAAEAESLKQLDVPALAEFGESLISKRIGMIRKWLPLSFTALDRHLSPKVVNRHLDRFTQDFPRDGDEYAGIWRRRESARVCEYLRRLVHHRVIPLPAVADMIAFETEWLRLLLDPEVAESARAQPAGDEALSLTDDVAIVCPPYVSVQAYRYNVPLLVGLIQSGCGIDDIEEEPCWVVFVRARSSASVDTHAVGEGSHAILRQCLEPRPVGSVVASLRSAYGTGADLEVAVRRELARLITVGALTFAGALTRGAARRDATPCSRSRN